MNAHDAFVIFNAVPGCGPATIRALAEFFGSVDSALVQDEGPLVASGIVNPQTAQNIVHFPKDKFLEDEYNLTRQKNVRILTAADDDFPSSLREIPGSPVVLYTQGDVALLHGACIAMVGSRNASHYGMTIAHAFARRFAEAGLIVVSGLARGIDSASHQGCLDAKGKTIAVVAGGLSHLYPKENIGLMRTIVEQGAMVSEMPMAVFPLPAHFPRRNRIITGLSTATVVVEAGAKSGALISAGYALEQGKDVFAVPSNIDNVCAEGSNRLIKDGARIALSADDVLEELKGQMEISFPALSTPEQTAPRVALSAQEMKAYDVLSLQPLHVDQLSARVRQPASDMAQVLLNLQLKGVVRQLPGQFFVRT